MVNIGKMHAKCKVRKTQIKGQNNWSVDLWWLKPGGTQWRRISVLFVLPGI